MKYINKILFFVLVLFTFTLSVNAADFSTTMTTNKSSITAGQQFTVTVGVKGAKDLYGLTASLSYDTSKLKYVSSNGQSDFTPTVGNNLVVDAAAPKSGTFNVATITFKATSNFAIGESSTIKISGIEGSDGKALLTGSSSSVTIKMVAPKNTNNYLRSLSITDSDIRFNKSTTSYKVTVDYEISSVKISATTEDEKAKVSGTGNHELNLYNNDLKVVVTAENGSTRTYTITVIRKDKDGNTRELSSDVTLSNLTITGYPIVFDTNTKEYTVLLKDSKLLNIVAIPTNEAATVEVVNPESYSAGNNVIKVKVIAENGAVEEYKINAILVKEEDTKTNATKKTTCKEAKCNLVPVIIISVLGTLLVCTITFLVFAKKGYIKIKSSNTKTKLEKTLVNIDENAEKKD